MCTHFWKKKQFSKYLILFKDSRIKNSQYTKLNAKIAAATYKEKCGFGKKIEIHIDKFHKDFIVPIIIVWDFIYTCSRCESFCYPEVSVMHYQDLVKYIDEINL